MLRNKIFGALALLCVAGSPFGLGQSKDRDRRVTDALADIRLLKDAVDQQNRRIADLEKTVKALQAEVANAEKPASYNPPRITSPASARWQIPSAWTQLKMGMSRFQVEEILGPPTSVDSVIDYQTLVFKSELPGAGTLSGTVKLSSDRVYQVMAPEFR